MDTELAWLSEVIVELDAALVDRGITNNRYGLISFGSVEEPDLGLTPVSVGASWFGTALEFEAAVSLLSANSDVRFEYGYTAMDYPLAHPGEYDLRDDTAVGIVLVTDEDADDYSASKYDELIQKLSRDLCDPRPPLHGR